MPTSRGRALTNIACAEDARERGGTEIGQVVHSPPKTLDPAMHIWPLPLLLVSTLGVLGNAEQCGGNLSAVKPGYVTSVKYPEDYPPHLKCEWLITAPLSDMRLVINFNPHFDVEGTGECRYDFVAIYDGPNQSSDLLGRFCGKIAPTSLISSGANIFIQFRSDYASQGAGFLLRYEIYETDECSKTFTTPNGTIQSPDFPQPYPHNLDCNYIITAPPRAEIILRFVSFELESEVSPPESLQPTECRFDHLEIWDGLPKVGPLIGRFCGKNSPDEVRSMSGVLSLTFVTDQGIARDGFQAIYHIIPRRIIEAVQCTQPLGVESGSISDEQMSASSTYESLTWLPQQGRLHHPHNAWTPASDSIREWIQVDLGSLRLVSGLATQGAVSQATHKAYFVSSFRIDISSNGEDWLPIKEGRQAKVFQGNMNATSVAETRLQSPVLARAVRLRPQTWHEGIALRFEIYGCNIADYPCSDMLGLMSGQIPDEQITASSESMPDWITGAARLLNPISGWAPLVGQEWSKRPWLQVDLGREQMVRGIMLQGVREGPFGGPAFVKRFQLATSLDGHVWNFVTADNTDQPQVFDGNSNYDTPEMRKFEPVMVQFVKLYPLRRPPGGMGIRMELLGCDMLETEEPPTLKTYGERECSVSPEDCSNESSTEPGGPTISARNEGFDCNFGDDQNHTVCGWQTDLGTPLQWSLGQSHDGAAHAPTSVPERGSYTFIQGKEGTGIATARLLSPILETHARGYHCLSFWYFFRGSGSDSLHFSIRSSSQSDMDRSLWKMAADKVSHWKEGRVIIPQLQLPFQIVLEGVVGDDSTSFLAVDDIRIAPDVHLANCLKPLYAIPGMERLPADDVYGELTLPPDNIYLQEDMRHSTKHTGSWETLVLETREETSRDGTGHTAVTEIPPHLQRALDPVLLAVIVVCSVGVTLGIVCASVLLYRSCQPGHTIGTARSSSGI
uniref:neuropilin-2-like n=1 Tax=Myxine glutinosa TaxID=7769 RepID=UPI00358EFCDD